MPLKITLELVPHGDEKKKHTIGLLEIENDGTGTPGNGVGIGHYDVRIHGLVQDEPGHSYLDFWEKGRVENFDRTRGHWALVLEALKAVKTDYDPEAPAQP